MTLVVRVPVLSEQITVTLPRVSTAGRERIIALCFAILLTDQANVTVTIASRPSGIMATAQTKAVLTAMIAAVLEANFSYKKVIRATSIMKPASHFEIVPICLLTAVSVFSSSLTSLLIVPISVWSPVATTIPTQAPSATRVALKHMFFLSPRGICFAVLPSSSITDVTFSMGTDSPVRAASAEHIFVVSITRRSAGIRSPRLTTTISPGTRDSAGTFVFFPSRVTIAESESIAPKASAACAAEPSWMRPIIVLITMTPTIIPI
mmetsp:Transcript_26951/g.59217  ORF Transcript_26951/g.59217 Transcript_26951/m.59217 type:complete len:264 (-) Transcript_26951:427-1218(-)